MRRSGVADLPLHGGSVPEWLYTRMSAIGREIMRILVMEHGTSQVLSRLSDPFWFQALGCVMGMDWHSSGVTTSVIGALKSAVNPIFSDLGIYICGGRGKHSRKTPQELIEFSSKTGNNGEMLVRASRLTAKVDNSCIIDGYNLYLHSFIVSKSGEWVVIQQGMNPKQKMARRYHWHSANVKSFVDDPHTAIVGKNEGIIINLSDSMAEKNRKGIVEFLKLHPDIKNNEIKHLVCEKNHNILQHDIDSRRLGAIFTLAYEKQFNDFVDAILLPGVGPRTVQSLALISEIIYGGPSRFSDPARFTFAHGGKDSHPFPVPLKIYDESIQILHNAVEKAKISHSEKLKSLKALHVLANFIEDNCLPKADVNKIIEHENKMSHLYGGMTIYGPSREKKI